MKLTEVRDLALAIGAAAGAAAAAYAIGDDLIRSAARRRETLRARTVPVAAHLNLYLIAADYTRGGEMAQNYVRPASEAEAKASRVAEEIDGGPGVFAVTAQNVIVLPGTLDWDDLLAPGTHIPPKYYRVA